MCAQVDASLAQLILRLLDCDAHRRLSAAAALLHPFFDALSPMRALAQVPLNLLGGFACLSCLPCSATCLQGLRLV